MCKLEAMKTELQSPMKAELAGSILIIVKSAVLTKVKTVYQDLYHMYLFYFRHRIWSADRWLRFENNFAIKSSGYIYLNK